MNHQQAGKRSGRAIRLFALLLIAPVTVGSSPSLRAESIPALDTGSRFAAEDSAWRSWEGVGNDVRLGLANLAWKADSFSVELEEADDPSVDYLVRFPSPLKSEHPKNDRVCLEWYAARDEAGKLKPSPAIVVVHESGRGMTVGRLFARTLHRHGYHTFLLHLPSYGERSWGKKPAADEFLILIRQAVMDIRRAYDAVNALPVVKKDEIALQGTSLGGLVCATVAGVDAPYRAVFLMLAGGDLMGIIEKGQKDAASLREDLERAQVDPESLRKVVYQIEPNRFASRIEPEKVWLFSGKYDQVIPLENAHSLAEKAGLPPEHHVLMPVNHYSGIFYFPLITQQIHDQLQKILSTGAAIAPVP